MKSISHDTQPRRERGGASLKLILLLVVIVVVAYIGYLYVPVAYRASLYKIYMQDTVDKAVATGKPASWVEEQLKDLEGEYDVPDDAVFKIQNRDGYLEANARWTYPIELPGYVYEYDFDHTVKSTGLFKQN